MASKFAAALLLALPTAAATYAEVSHEAAIAGFNPSFAEDESSVLLQHLKSSTSDLKTVRQHANETQYPSAASQPKMKDVRRAFMALSDEDGRVLEANIGGVPIQGYNRGMMPYSEHFQSVQRAQDSTVIYFSGAGETAHSGQIFVMDFGSRPPTGAMGSNVVQSSTPPANDVLKGIMNIDKDYVHAGGMSSYGNILAVGCEPACAVTDRVLGGCKAARRIHFFDTTTPSMPKRLPFVVEKQGITAGTTSLTQQDNGQFLLVVGGTGAEQLDFYLSQSTTLMNGDPGFRQVTSWYKNSLLVDAGTDASYGAYQTMNFVKQEDGGLFLVGLYRSSNGLGSDYADLFKVDSSSKGITLTKQGHIKLKCASGTCNFQAAAGVYVASPDLLLIYAGDWEPNWKENAIFVNEFRPKGTASGNKCDQITGGTCRYSGCSSSRGPTICSHDTCICQDGYCNEGGRCVPDKSSPR